MTTPATPGMAVVGGGPAGLEAVRGYLDSGGAGPVTMLSDDVAPPYARPPLSIDFLRGELGENQLPMADAAWWNSGRVRLRLGTVVERLDHADRALLLTGGERLPYSVCVLAIGSEPTPLPVAGADHPQVRQLRSLAQGRTLRDAAATATNAVVVGSGFIGCEAAASLAMRGLSVTLLAQEERPQQARLGPAVGERIAGWLRDAGVELVLPCEVQAIVDGRRVEIAGRAPVEAELVLVAAGITPRAELAGAAGLAVDDGRVVVDSRMRTSVPGVWAAGDVALAHNELAGRRLAVEHWGEALAMGRVAGADAAGGETSWAEAPGFWSDIRGHMLKVRSVGRRLRHHPVRRPRQRLHRLVRQRWRHRRGADVPGRRGPRARPAARGVGGTHAVSGSASGDHCLEHRARRRRSATDLGPQRRACNGELAPSRGAEQAEGAVCCSDHNLSLPSIRLVQVVQTVGVRDDVRTGIVDGAAQLLRELGAQAVTTRAVAQAAGVQAPTIYRLFGDKDGLIDAVAEHVMAIYVDTKSVASGQAEGDPVADLRAGWQLHVEFG
ncbi:MAG: FAD-dependent oxidoreductase, partial [Actinomycetota bacterium]|nr:FAD-dependent oxidoreductase [Actinomycetota bacterium]